MHALVNGLIGAGALTALHETGRRVLDAPPRMDLVGMRGLDRMYRFAGAEPPTGGRLFALTLVGDLVSNAIYYSAVGSGRGKGTWGRAVALGLAAGVGAVLLPRHLGLGEPPNNERAATRWLTIGYYLAGALAAAAAANRVRPAPLGYLGKSRGGVSA